MAAAAFTAAPATVFSGSISSLPPPPPYPLVSTSSSPLVPPDPLIAADPHRSSTFLVRASSEKTSSSIQTVVKDYGAGQTWVTQVDLHRLLHALGAGSIEEVCIQHDKGFGFVRYSNHAEASTTIQIGNSWVLCGKPIGIGSIEEVCIEHDKGFGFVRYNNHAEASTIIQTENARVLCGKPIKVTQVDLHRLFPYPWCWVY